MDRLITKTLQIILSFFLSSVFAQSITFTFANGQVNGNTYAFDVMAQAGTPGTRIGDTMVYFNYNTAAFGSNIAAQITVTKGTLMEGTLGMTELYNIVAVANNTSSRIAITGDFAFDGSGLGNDLPTTPDQLLHIEIDIINTMENAGLSFEQSLMDGQQSQDDLTEYTSVILGNTDDTSLPVELSVFAAESLDGKVLIKWQTESEINNLGFELYRAENEDGDYLLLSNYKLNPALYGQGNSGIQHIYNYTDETTKPETAYWYKLADLDYSGVETFHGPISIKTPEAIPENFKLQPSYPNPFNPSTTIRFDIPASDDLVDTRLIIYNSLGQVVKNLFQQKVSSGSYEVLWDGTTDLGIRVPNGIYFCFFTANKFYQTGHLVLIK